MDNSGTIPVCVPGFGLPIAHEKEADRGADFDYGPGSAGERLLVREISMLKFMNAVTDKPDWETKVKNEEIVAKWKAEVQDPENGDDLMSDGAFEWCIQELRDKAEKYAGKGFVGILDANSRVAKGDSIISEELRQELINALKPLYEAEEKDWHPNSNNQVLNLVHPSLYPVMYGKTRVLRTGQVSLLDVMDSVGKGESTSADQDIPLVPISSSWYPQSTKYFSSKFQWLPAEVKFADPDDKESTEVKITSYINNLHPVTHKDIYPVIEKFISKAIPAWNDVLVRNTGIVGPRISAVNAIFTPEYPNWRYNFSEKTEEAIAKVKEFLALPDNPNYQSTSEEDEDEEDEDEELDPNWESPDGWPIWRVVDWKWKRCKMIHHPDVNNSGTYEQWKKGERLTDLKAPYASLDGPALDSNPVNLQTEYHSKGLQIIIKLSSIELTPDKPKYEGGSWHLEGMGNEHIAATAIYYYDVENVTDSHLSLRQEAMLKEIDLEYEQDQHEYLAEIFGTETMRDEAAVQELGSVSTPQGRLVVFPNTLQHKVEPFELKDKTKPGHRRFLVLWLVDPNYRILSSANVAPQQRNWWLDETMTIGWNASLPPELSNMVISDAAKFWVGINEAKEMRLELMSERTSYADGVEKNFEQYNLCEH